jgi:hypothetical protein
MATAEPMVAAPTTTGPVTPPVWLQFPDEAPKDWQKPPGILMNQTALDQYRGIYLEGKAPPTGYPGLTLHVATVSRIAHQLVRFLRQEHATYPGLGALEGALSGNDKDGKKLREEFEVWNRQYDEYRKQLPGTGPYPPPALQSTMREVPGFLVALETRVRAHDEYVVTHLFRMLYASLFTGDPVRFVQTLHQVFALAKLPSDGLLGAPQPVKVETVPVTYQFVSLPSALDVPEITDTRIYSTAAIPADLLEQTNKAIVATVQSALKQRLKTTLEDVVKKAKERQQEGMNVSVSAQRTARETEEKAKEAKAEAEKLGKELKELKDENASTKSDLAAEQRKFTEKEREAEQLRKQLVTLTEQVRKAKEKTDKAKADKEAEEANAKETKERNKEAKERQAKAEKERREADQAAEKEKKAREKAIKTAEAAKEAATKEEQRKKDFEGKEKKLKDDNARLEAEIERLRADESRLQSAQEKTKQRLVDIKTKTNARIEVLRAQFDANTNIATEKNLFKARLAHMAKGRPLAKILEEEQRAAEALAAKAGTMQDEVLDDELKMAELSSETAMVAYNIGGSEIVGEVKALVDKIREDALVDAAYMQTIADWITEFFQRSGIRDDGSVREALTALLVKFAGAGISTRRRFLASLFTKLFSWFGSTKDVNEATNAANQTLDAFNGQLDVLRTEITGKMSLAILECGLSESMAGCFYGKFPALLSGVTFGASGRLLSTLSGSPTYMPPAPSGGGGGGSKRPSPTAATPPTSPSSPSHLPPPLSPASKPKPSSDGGGGAKRRMEPESKPEEGKSKIVREGEAPNTSESPSIALPPPPITPPPPSVPPPSVPPPSVPPPSAPIVAPTRSRGVVPPSMAQTLATIIEEAGDVEQMGVIASVADTVQAVFRLS